MIDWIWSAVGNTASWWVLGVLVLIVLAFWLGWFAPKKKAFGDAETFDAMIGGFKPSAAADILRKFTPEALKTYEFQARVVDMLFPIFYALAIAVWIRLCGPDRPELRWLIVLPFSAALFDWLENLSVASLISRFRKNPDDLGNVPTLLFIAQRLKWLHFGALVIVLVVITIRCVRGMF